MMNSPTSSCHKCDYSHLGVLYLFLSYILPVSVLFYIIMSYNIRMTTGLISAYLFFSQIIGNHYYYTALKVNTDLEFTTSNIIVAIYSISNLEFFQHDIFFILLVSKYWSWRYFGLQTFSIILSIIPSFHIFHTAPLLYLQTSILTEMETVQEINCTWNCCFPCSLFCKN